MKHIAFHTLGCKLNFSETATLARECQEKGYALVDFGTRADIVVLNTCSVTERADRECRQLVRRAKRTSPDALIVVTGCYAQLQPETIAAIPGVNLVLGTREKAELLDHLNSRASHERRVNVSNISEATEIMNAASTGFADRTRSFLKIQDGCDYNCSFCTIPLARGRSRSIPAGLLEQEARSIVEQGFREIVLTGVNVGDYGKSSGSSLLDLLNVLTRIDGLERVRVSSIEPNLLTDELLEFWLSHDVMCPHFHIPLQSGSDPILKSMRRRYQREWYANRLQRIKEMVPDAGIGSDVIVGFPGETNSHFEETYRFLVDMPVSYLHVFTYSERPNTAALSIEGSVEMRERARRSERLRMLSVRKRQLFHKRFVGKNVSVLLEGKGADGVTTGLTREYVRVNIPGEYKAGAIEEVLIERTGDGVCWGVPLNASSESQIVRNEVAA